MNIYLSTNANNSSPELFKCLRKYNSKLNYLNSFLVSPIKKLSFDGTNYVNVVMNAESLNLSYVDNLDFLREATITFIETNAGGN